MYLVMAFSLIVSLTVAAPTEDGRAEIISYDNNNYGDGSYQFSFEASNGISRRESGKLVNIGEPDEHMEVEGIYSYTDTEGQLVVVHYTADENGYRIYDVDDESKEIISPEALPAAAVASLLG